MRRRVAAPVVALFVMTVAGSAALVANGMGAFAQRACPPTPTDSEGPFYVPGAPERQETGRGLVVRGTVRSSRGCTPIPGALIERWQASPDGQYDDAHRASMKSDGTGEYRFESDFPRRYFGRPPHIHYKVFAAGHRPLTTQLYLTPGQTQVTFDLVLVPE